MKPLVFPRIRGAWLACAFLFTAAVASCGAADTPAKIKLLIIEGVSNHDRQHRLALVREILARDGSFAVEVSITPSRADDPAWATWRPDFSKYDVVLSGYNNLGGKPRWPVEVRQAFEKYVRTGGGFYVYHEANNSFAEWPEYNQMIGLGWRNKNFGKAIVVRPDESLQIIPAGEGDNTGHGNRSDVVVHQLGEHPIHTGLPRAWKAADIEVYRYARGTGHQSDDTRVCDRRANPASVSDRMDGAIWPGPGLCLHLRPCLGGSERSHGNEVRGLSNHHGTRVEMAGQASARRCRAGRFSNGGGHLAPPMRWFVPRRTRR